MNKRMTLLLIILTLALLIPSSVALAKNTKYTFNDVVIDGQTVEIEAAAKTTKNSDYSTCSYYADDYANYLGMYADDVRAGDTAEEVLDFCVANFENRTQ